MSRSAFLTITNLTASSISDLLLNADQGPQNMRFIRQPTRCVLAINGSAAGEAELEVRTQNRTIVPRSGLSGGGTAGVMPSLETYGFSFALMAGEILEIALRETAGAGTIDVTAFIQMNP